MKAHCDKSCIRFETNYSASPLLREISVSRLDGEKLDAGPGCLAGKKRSEAVAAAREFEMKRIERTRTNNTFENFDYESKIGLIPE